MLNNIVNSFTSKSEDQKLLLCLKRRSKIQTRKIKTALLVFWKSDLLIAFIESNIVGRKTNNKE
jgi:hypothetical protein